MTVTVTVAAAQQLSINATTIDRNILRPSTLSSKDYVKEATANAIVVDTTATTFTISTTSTDPTMDERTASTAMDTYEADKGSDTAAEVLNTLFNTTSTAISSETAFPITPPGTESTESENETTTTDRSQLRHY